MTQIVIACAKCKKAVSQASIQKHPFQPTHVIHFACHGQSDHLYLPANEVPPPTIFVFTEYRRV